MDEEETQLADNVIKYVNGKLTERNLILDNILFFTPKHLSAEAQYYTWDDSFIFYIYYDLNLPNEGEYCVDEENEDKCIPSIKAIDRVYRDWMSDGMSIDRFEIEMSEGRLFNSIFYNNVNEVSIWDETVLKKYGSEIEKIVGEDFRKAVDLGFRIYDDFS